MPVDFKFLLRLPGIKATGILLPLILWVWGLWGVFLCQTERPQQCQGRVFISCQLSTRSPVRTVNPCFSTSFWPPRPGCARAAGPGPAARRRCAPTPRSRAGEPRPRPRPRPCRPCRSSVCVWQSRFFSSRVFCSDVRSNGRARNRYLSGELSCDLLSP